MKARHHTKLELLKRDVKCRYEFPQKWHLSDLDWRLHAVENQKLGIRSTGLNSLFYEVYSIFRGPWSASI